jgi:hypothetical protein
MEYSVIKQKRIAWQQKISALEMIGLVVHEITFVQLCAALNASRQMIDKRETRGSLPAPIRGKGSLRIYDLQSVLWSVDLVDRLAIMKRIVTDNSALFIDGPYNEYTEILRDLK